MAYMLPHLYWAMGGTVGMSLLRPTVLELPQWEVINGVASVLLTGAGLLGLAFVYLRGGRFLRRGLLAIALMGCSIATSHGVYGIKLEVLSEPTPEAKRGSVRVVLCG
jgi:hypothetical protein